MAKLRLIKLSKNKAKGAVAAVFRTTPIKETIKQIKQLPTSAILYKCAASQFWQFRVFLEGAQRKRSTKTTDYEKAQTEAKLIYANMLQTVHGGTEGKRKLSSKSTLDIVAKSLFAKQEVMISQGELSKNKNKLDKYIYQKHIKTFFADTDIKRINSDKLEHFKAYLVGLKLAKSTQKVYFNIVSKLLKEGVKKEFITHMPIIPRVRMEDEPRGYFNNGEYTKLWKAAKKYTDKEFKLHYKADSKATADEQDTQSKQVVKKTRKNAADTTTYRTVKITVDCLHMILFMRNTYIRPTDLKVIRHSDVHYYRKDGITLLELRHKATKRHSNYMASNPQAVEHYEKILAERKREGYGNAADYIFLPHQKNRDYALKELTRQFVAILEVTNLKTDSQNRSRTLYSLRHTAIVTAIRQGIPISHIAANSRTSINMINRFYGSHINSALEMSSHIIDNIRRRQDEQQKKAEQKAAAADAEKP